MRHFVCKYWALVVVMSVTLFLSACGEEPANEYECEASRDCGVGEICHLNFCVEEGSECFLDDDCNTYEQCNGLICVENETCEGESECAPDKTCSGGQCVDRQCNSDSDCFSGLECSGGLCRTIPRQCQNVGESCDPEQASRLGFSCEDLGSGPTCYRKCNRYRVCLDSGQASRRYDCGAGSACVESNVSVPVCQPSECGGFFSAQEDCAETVADDPSSFPDGVQCALVQEEAFTCQPAGQTSEGVQCNVTSDCEEGLLCLSDFGPYGIFVNPLSDKRVCTQACDSDSMCDDGESCIGASAGAFEGVGVCGERCDPFSFDEQCSADRACVAVTSDDGICFRETTRESEHYGSCTTNDECPDNSQCLATGDGMSRCQPLCDPTLGTQAERNATCPTAADYGFVELAHFAADGFPVEVLVDGELVRTLQPGETTEGSYLQVQEGNREITVRDESTGQVLLEEMVTVSRLTAATIAVVGDTVEAGGLTALANEVPRGITGSQDQALIRLVHGVAGLGDVAVVIVEEDGSVSDASARVLDVDSISYGQAIGFAAITLDAGVSESFDIHVFEAGTDGSSPYLIIDDYEFTDGEVASYYLVGDVRPADADDHIGPDLMTVSYTEPPEGRKLGGYCQDVFANEGLPPEIGSGFCRETCATSDDWGGNGCTDSNDACWPVGSGLGWCLPGANGSAQVGDDCSDDDDCTDGAFCDPSGIDTGTCRSYCQTQQQTNPHLGCESGEACIPREGYTNFGECRLPCNPGSDYIDTESCPSGQVSCIGEAGQAYCSPSGSIGLGQDCGTPTEQNCSPGLVCAQNGRDLNEIILDPFSSLNDNSVATCRELCEPFTGVDGNSGCSDGYACSPIAPSGESTTFGHCVESIEATLPSLSDCAAEDIGKMCDENSFCIPASSNACVEQRGQCLQFCDFATGQGCTGGTTCTEGFAGGPLLGLYGLCR